MSDEPTGIPQRYSSRVDLALCFAAEKHASGLRKGTSTPYIVHPVHVAWLLAAYGLNEDTVIAGLLHDVLEDTECTAAEIEARFGAAVSAVVLSCSELDKGRPWEERKRDMVTRMRSMTPAARAVECADKAHNLHTMADALEGGEAKLWERFKRGPEAQVAYHRAALAARADGFDHPILHELRGALARVERLLPSV